MDSVPFCDRINDAGRVIVNPGMDDLHQLVDRIRRSEKFSVSLERTGDMDSGIELISTLEGTVIFGCEDSLRGSFAFYYCDPTKTAKLFEIEIYEVPKYALCDNLENALQIADLFFRQGELDRRFSWMLDIGLPDDTTKYENLLAAGSELALPAFIAQVRQESTR